MKIIRITEDEKEFMFVCDSRGTRSGFAHDCTLFINNVQEAEATCHYINRTWEVYQYQTVCLCALDNVISEFTDRVKKLFMQSKGYKRLTAARAEELDNQLSLNVYLNTLRAVEKQIRYKIY